MQRVAWFFLGDNTYRYYGWKAYLEMNVAVLLFL